MMYRRYFEALSTILHAVVEEEGERIQTAAQWCVESILKGGLIHTFGTGHSHMLVEEMFYRAGGLVTMNPILDSSLMLHIDAPKSSRLERLPGLAEKLLEGEPVIAGDVMFIFSNSGRNAAPIEMAEAARKRGCKVIAITSLAHSGSVTSRHPSGRKLYHVADLTIDNHGVPGDAVLPIEGSAGEGPEGNTNSGTDATPAGGTLKTAATSTTVGAAIVDAIVAEVTAGIVKRGQRPPVLMSSNLDGAEMHNAKVYEDYALQTDRLRHRGVTRWTS